MSESDKPPSTVLVSNRQEGVLIEEAEVVSLAEATLEAEGVGPAELSVSYVDESEIARLHEQYMHEPGPTDVLSFPIDEMHDGRRLLGDVVICPSFASRNNEDLDSELRLLLVHGILHLLGYDHEEDEERAVMWARQERYSGVAL